MAKVKLENVYKVYEGGVRAVNEFNLDIPDKEFVVFVGPSGCGKSTTLRMIAGLEDITQGKLYINDEVVNDVESKNRDIAMVFQNYALYPHMTVYQNMAFGLKLKHTPKEVIDEKVKSAAEILEISELLSRKPKALSGGQRQRVALGRAIVREPKVFLLDEPLSNLDAKLRVQMRSEITKLHEKLKTTFIYVTHDQTEAMTMGTRIVVMKDGFIQQVDTPISLFEEPANLFVATFLGSPQMNIMNAFLRLEKNKLSAELVDTSKKFIVKFSDIKRKELLNDEYANKEVLLGIRPDAIKIDPKGDIDAVVDVVEQLGDETIIYASVEGLKQNIILKAPFMAGIKSKQNIKLSFDMEQAHLFDKELQNTILGMRLNNDIKVVINEKKINIGKYSINLPELLGQTLLESAYGKELTMSVPVESISLVKKPGCVELPIKVDFTEEKTDYVSAYFSIEGLKETFVLKLRKDYEELPNVIYFPLNKIKIYTKEHELVNSKEIIYPNVVMGAIKNRDEEFITIRVNGKEFKVANKDEYKNLEGSVNVEFLPEGNEVVFNRKLNKENPEHNKELGKDNLLKFEAYDEYKGSNMNFIYGKVRGFENYVTFHVKNDFSVYKMDKFSIRINPNSIKLS